MAKNENVTLKLTLPRFVEIPTKGGGTLTVDRSRYAENALGYTFEYGERQNLNDCVSQEKENPEVPEGKRKAELKTRCLEIINKRLDGLYQGILPRGGGGRRSVYGPAWDEAKKLIKATQAEVNIKGVTDALAKAANDAERLTILVNQVGFPIAVRVKGRAATKAMAQTAVKNLFTKAQAAADRAAKDAEGLL